MRLRVATTYLKPYLCLTNYLSRPEQDTRDRTARIGQPGQDNQGRTARHDARTGQPGHDNPDGTGKAGQLGQERMIKR
jgi:hypothetical protein